MAWTSPKTWLAAVLSVADMNTHVRDNLLETVPAKASAAGQIPYANGVNSIAMLSAVARRMPRFNAAGNALETVANLSLAQAPLFASATAVNSSTSETDIVTRAITTVGGMVIVVGWATINESKSVIDSLFVHDYWLKRDTTQLGPSINNTGITGNATGLTAAYDVAPFIYLETPAAGTYTYRIRGLYGSFNTSGTPTADGALLVIEMAP